MYNACARTAYRDTDDELDASEIQSMTVNRPPAPIIAPSGNSELIHAPRNRFLLTRGMGWVGRSTIAPDVTIFNDDLPTDGEQDLLML